MEGTSGLRTDGERREGNWWRGREKPSMRMWNNYQENFATPKARHDIRYKIFDDIRDLSSSPPLFLTLLQFLLCEESQPFSPLSMLSCWVLLTLQTCQSFISGRGGLIASVGGSDWAEWLIGRMERERRQWGGILRKWSRWAHRREGYGA